MKRVCIVNAHWSNRGDEAALRPIIDSIHSKNPSIEITVIFKDRKEIQQFPYDGNIKYFSAQYLPKSLEEIFDAVKGKRIIDNNMMSVIHTLKQTDLIIYSPGGAVISDKFWWEKQIEYLVPFICAKEYQIPMVVASPSIGPFDKDEEKNSLRKMWLSAAKTICIRESISAGYLKDLGLKNVITTVDTAFYDNPDPIQNAVLLDEQKELNAFLSSQEKVIAVTLSDFLWHVEHAKKKDLIKRQKETVRKFLARLNAKGCGILLIPQLFGNQNDTDYLTQFMAEGRFILSDRLDTYFQQYIISKCYAVIGMRYHSNIFAAKMAVPFIAIGYEEKMYGFMETWNLKDYLIKLEDLNEETFQNKWELLLENYESYHKQLLACREIWREKAAITITAALKEIEKIHI